MSFIVSLREEKSLKTSTLSAAVEIIRERYPYLSKEYGIKKIGIFGSIARNADRTDSDIDLVIEFTGPIGLKFIELTEYFERLFDRKVDILTPDGIENIRNTKIADDIKRSIVYV